MKRRHLLTTLCCLLLIALTAVAATRLICTPHPRGLTREAQAREWRDTIQFVAGALLD